MVTAQFVDIRSWFCEFKQQSGFIMKSARFLDIQNLHNLEFQMETDSIHIHITNLTGTCISETPVSYSKNVAEGLDLLK